MKKNRSIPFKAAFLLLVFSLNMVVGLACAMGMEMGFNSPHHPKTDVVKVHTHSNGEKHEHHNKVDEHQKKVKNTEPKEKEGCCSDAVLKIAQTDIAVPQISTVGNAMFFTSLIPFFCDINIFYTHQIIENFKYFLQNYHPPIPDIRIAIQSFQI